MIYKELKPNGLSELKSGRKFLYVVGIAALALFGGDESYPKLQEDIAFYDIEKNVERLANEANQLGIYVRRAIGEIQEIVNDINKQVGNLEKRVDEHERRIEGLEKAAEDYRITREHDLKKYPTSHMQERE